MKDKYTIKTYNSDSLSYFPPTDWELESNRILANNVIFDGEYNPHKVKLWVIGNVYGAVAAVWAENTQDALDEAVDNDLMDCFATDDDDECARLGNAGETFDLSDCWIFPAKLKDQELDLLLAFAEARGAAANKLSDI